MKVAFSGIYDIRFPYGVSDEEIKKKYSETKIYIDENYNQRMNIVNVALKDSFNVQKTDKKLADKGFRITTCFDNPWVISDILFHINENLVQQYIDKSKVELIFDKMA